MLRVFGLIDLSSPSSPNPLSCVIKSVFSRPGGGRWKGKISQLRARYNFSPFLSPGVTFIEERVICYVQKRIINFLSSRSRVVGRLLIFRVGAGKFNGGVGRGCEREKAQSFRGGFFFLLLMWRNPAR